MYKRVLISVGTAVVLILVAACGFMLGNRVKVQTQDTENGQSAYMSSEQENAEAAASDGDEDTTASDGNTVQENSGGDSASSGTGDITESGSGDEASGQGDESQSVSGEAGVSSDTSLHTDSSVNTDDSVNADDVSTINGFQPASGAYEYIIYAEDGTLVVYYSDAATVYFDSGIEVQHLPEETRNQVEQGITFQSEEELFGFLESYSS